MVLDLLAEFNQFLFQGGKPIADGIGQIDLVHCRVGETRPLGLDDTTRDADDRRIWRHILQDDGIGTDLDVITDLDAAENLGPGADDNVIAKGRVPLSTLLPGASERNPLEQCNVVADFCSLPDHHSHSMVNEESRSDLCRGMDFNPSEPSRQLGNRPGEEWNSV